MYHDVRIPDPSWFPLRYSESWVITPDRLFDQLGRLKSSSLALLDVRNPCEESGVYVTFDDGLKDHLHYAASMCEDLEIPGVFFISSACAEGILALSHKIQFAMASRRESECVKWLFRECKGASSLYDRYSISLHPKNVWSPEKVFITRFLRDNPCCVDPFFDWACPVDEKEIASNLYLNEREAMQLSNRMAVGGHGHSHLRLDSLSSDEAFLEIKQSCGRSWCNTRAISYPHGGWNTDTLSAARKLGIRYGFAVRESMGDNLTILRTCGATNGLPC